MLDAILAQSRNTALIMGLIAMIGLLLQKKHATDVISGTMKTVIGFMVFNIGSSAMSGVVQTFTDLFNVAFGIEGVTTQVGRNRSCIEYLWYGSGFGYAAGLRCQSDRCQIYKI